MHAIPSSNSNSQTPPLLKEAVKQNNIGKTAQMQYTKQNKTTINETV
jgi:hypothetical protein